MLEKFDLLKQAFFVAVEQAMPANIMLPYLPPLPKGRLIVVGAGKAAADMARVAENNYGLENLEGLVITRYGHAVETKKIKVVEASHPSPDKAGFEASKEIINLCRNLNQDDLVLFLLSGGGSALFTQPDGISLAEKTKLNQILLKSGASIHEINLVRKQFSKVKGGRFAEIIAPARVVSLIISDVVDDDLSVIASGPTVADYAASQDAIKILQKYGIYDEIYLDALENKDDRELYAEPEFLREAPKTAKNYLIASNQQSLEAVQKYFEQKGINSYILSSSIEGEAREAAKFHAAIVKQILEHNQPFSKPCVLISGGETTVTVKKKGKGGRNSEFLLALAIELASYPNITAFAADTDGIDGSEDNAGAFFDSNILAKIPQEKMIKYLDNNDSYSFFKEQDWLFVSQPTRTNVNDLRLIFLDFC